MNAPDPRALSKIQLSAAAFWLAYSRRSIKRGEIELASLQALRARQLLVSVSERDSRESSDD